MKKMLKNAIVAFYATTCKKNYDIVGTSKKENFYYEKNINC